MKLPQDSEVRGPKEMKVGVGPALLGPCTLGGGAAYPSAHQACKGPAKCTLPQRSHKGADKVSIA